MGCDLILLVEAGIVEQVLDRLLDILHILKPKR